MDFVERMNGVTNYIEAHLDSEMDEAAICRIMACSYKAFQQSFTQIAGISITEYIRRRRMTEAAYALQIKQAKVIDVSSTYGYTSPDAFRVAFRQIHGLNPSQAKHPDVILKYYAKLEFEMTIKGVSEMDYKVIEKPTFTVLGKRATTEITGGTWAIVKSDGSLDLLKAMANTEEALGLCFGFDAECNNDYMCGVPWDDKDWGQVMAEKDPITLQDKFDLYTFPDLIWLVFLSEGPISENVLSNTWVRVLNEFLPNSHYKKMNLPTIERYIKWDEQSDYCKVEVRIPVE